MEKFKGDSSMYAYEYIEKNKIKIDGCFYLIKANWRNLIEFWLSIVSIDLEQNQINKNGSISLTLGDW